MDKKTKKKIAVLKKKIATVKQQIKGEKEQPDDPMALQILEAGLLHLQQQLEKLQPKKGK